MRASMGSAAVGGQNSPKEFVPGFGLTFPLTCGEPTETGLPRGLKRTSTQRAVGTDSPNARLSKRAKRFALETGRGKGT